MRSQLKMDVWLCRIYCPVFGRQTEFMRSPSESDTQYFSASVLSTQAQAQLRLQSHSTPFPFESV